MSISFCSKIGKRPSNEDSHIISDNLFAIFDGHGGAFCSKYLKEIFPDLISRLNGSFNKTEINELFDLVQLSLINKYQTRLNNVGSTALICIINDKYLNIINLGDCRCIICNNNKPIQITVDHKPNKPDEKKRIEKLDGEIYKDVGDDWRVNCLSVSRSFGDLNAIPEVSHRPDIFTRRINKDDQFVVMACDGLWDVMTNLQVCQFILDELKDGVKIENIASNLAIYAIDKGSMDNITIIILFIL